MSSISTYAPRGGDVIDPRTKEVQEDGFDRALNIVTRSYLTQLKECEILPLPSEEARKTVGQYTRFYHLTEFVSAPKEDYLQKIITVLYTAYALNVGIAILLNSDGSTTDYYLGVITDGTGTADKGRTVQEAFCGSFPGSKLVGEFNETIEDLVQDAFEGGTRSVSVISGVPGIRDADKHSIENFVQGIENMTDALRGCSYTLLIKADPISGSDLETLRRSYQAISTELSPYERTVYTYSATDTISSSTTKGTSFSKTKTDTLNESTSYSHGSGFSNTTGSNQSTSISNGAKLALGVGAVVAAAAGLALLPNPLTAAAAKVAIGTVGSAMALGGTAGSAFLGTQTKGTSTSDSRSSTDTHTTSRTTGYSYSNSQSTNVSDTDSQSRADGESKQFTLESQRIIDIRKKIEENLKHLDECVNYGAFECAAYVVSDTYAVSQRVASVYSALMRGDKSSLQSTQITTWHGSEAKALLPYLSHFKHPRFEYSIVSGSTILTPALFESGKELALQVGLPKRSVPGVAVARHAEFGSNPPKEKHSLKLGTLFRMGNEEDSVPVLLNQEHLTSHTFITGSTGSGKSNTIYHILDELCYSNIHFLVVEPAKGEYKNIFGGRSDVQVYGTNPRLTPLLRIDPFYFPEEKIHVLEHLDRLVELFNVCWPMYAAMPAILKDACERAYESVGWDLVRSVNLFGKDRFPSFDDVLEQIRLVINESDYSADNKSDYSGALVTRIRSLTTGLNREIFTPNALSGAELFDKNVIVDLSRVGSVETKSLIMSMLVMQLQEYRMATQGRANNSLRHITVLEEAHNILKRTSTEQSSESSNLAGKAVEMLGNAVAEMRTYGEGFMIADQAPGLMDMAVIRNTNTKIILRLPDEEDRKLVGKAAGLNDDQISELAKLPTGVAAVYQNNWLEPVLCQITQFTQEKPFIYRSDTDGLMPQILTKYLSTLSICSQPPKFEKAELSMLERWAEGRCRSQKAKDLFRQSINKPLSEPDRDTLLYTLLDGQSLCQKLYYAKKDQLDMLLTQWIVMDTGINQELSVKLCRTMLHSIFERISGVQDELGEKMDYLKLRGWA